jgi:hypothetical protein
MTHITVLLVQRGLEMRRSLHLGCLFAVGAVGFRLPFLRRGSALRCRRDKRATRLHVQDVRVDARGLGQDEGEEGAEDGDAAASASAYRNLVLVDVAYKKIHCARRQLGGMSVWNESAPGHWRCRSQLCARQVNRDLRSRWRTPSVLPFAETQCS